MCQQQATPTLILWVSQPKNRIAKYFTIYSQLCPAQAGCIYVRDFGLALRNIKNCALLGHYTASNGNLVSTFRDNLLVPSSGVKRTALFWVITQLVVEVSYRRFGQPIGLIFRSQKNCALLGHYTASSGNLLQTFRDNLSVTSSGVKRTALFWVITQLVVVISYRRFGTTYRSHLQGSRELRSSGSLHS